MILAFKRVSGSNKDLLKKEQNDFPFKAIKDQTTTSLYYCIQNLNL
jgi:hypothetical protein